MAKLVVVAFYCCSCSVSMNERESLERECANPQHATQYCEVFYQYLEVAPNKSYERAASQVRDGSRGTETEIGKAPEIDRQTHR